MPAPSLVEILANCTALELVEAMQEAEPGMAYDVGLLLLALNPSKEVSGPPVGWILTERRSVILKGWSTATSLKALKALKSSLGLTSQGAWDVLSDALRGPVTVLEDVNAASARMVANAFRDAGMDVEEVVTANPAPDTHTVHLTDDLSPS